MKLEKFSKNTKQKKIMISAIIGLILLVGGITLYRTFALYEEKKEFNVLKGKVPEFTNGDVKFAFLLDETSSKEAPSKDSGYHFAGSECTHEAKATWNEITWNASVSNLQSSGTVCTLKFKKFDLENSFNYGDGSLNTVGRSCAVDTSYRCTSLNSTVGGYVDKLYLYNFETGEDTKITNDSQNYVGNFNAYFSSDQNLTNTASTVIDYNTVSIKSGENEYGVNGFSGTRGDNKSIINIRLHWGYSGYGKKISNIRLNLDGTYYTLKSAVDNKKIKPIVLLIGIDTNSSEIGHLGDNASNLYNGGAVQGFFSDIRIHFILENNVLFKSIKFNSSEEMKYPNEIVIGKTNNQIYHLQ